VLDAIGGTPLLDLDGVWVKLEFLNPSGSIKARIARYIVERAEREGLLRAGDVIVEASSGNTGNAMSMVAAAKGYRMLVLMPNGMSRERAAISRAFGAEVVTIGDFHVNDALAAVKELGARPGYFSPAQFDNEWNVQENKDWLGAEILGQLPEGVLPDAVLGGVGTGGTVIGVGQAFREVNPACQVVALEPDESCTILCGEVGKHLIEGMDQRRVRAGHRPAAPRRDRPACVRRLGRRHRGDATPGPRARAVRRPELRSPHDRRPAAAGRRVRARRDVPVRRGREVPRGLLPRRGGCEFRRGT
jgi:cysteine synthase A